MSCSLIATLHCVVRAKTVVLEHVSWSIYCTYPQCLILAKSKFSQHSTERMNKQKKKASYLSRRQPTRTRNQIWNMPIILIHQTMSVPASTQTTQPALIGIGKTSPHTAKERHTEPHTHALRLLAWFATWLCDFATFPLFTDTRAVFTPLPPNLHTHTHTHLRRVFGGEKQTTCGRPF